MTTNTFICAICGEECKKGWSDAEALAEKEVIFGGIPVSECDLVCDDCFQKLGLPQGTIISQ